MPGMPVGGPSPPMGGGAAANTAMARENMMMRMAMHQQRAENEMLQMRLLQSQMGGGGGGGVPASPPMSRRMSPPIGMPSPSMTPPPPSSMMGGGGVGPGSSPMMPPMHHHHQQQRGMITPPEPMHPHMIQELQDPMMMRTPPQFNGGFPSHHHHHHPMMNMNMNHVHHSSHSSPLKRKIQDQQIAAAAVSANASADNLGAVYGLPVVGSIVAPGGVVRRGVTPPLLEDATGAIAQLRMADKQFELQCLTPSDLVKIEDRDLVPDSLLVAMSQMIPCKFTEEDRIGCYKTRKVGFTGMCCKHCGGEPGFGRYFPNSVRSLAQTTTSQTIIKHISGKCKDCPAEVREIVLTLQRQQAATLGRKLRYGSRKIFFQRMWDRLHGTKKEQEEQQGKTTPGNSSTSQDQGTLVSKDEDCASSIKSVPDDASLENVASEQWQKRSDDSSLSQASISASTSTTAEEQREAKRPRVC